MRWGRAQEILRNEPAYRVRQAYHGIFAECASCWNDVTSLPKTLRARLTDACPLTLNARLVPSADRCTTKALIQFDDGAQVETVLMRHSDGRNTVCVSSQVGCPMACTFCATGTMRLSRNLTAGEISAQVLLFARLLRKEKKRVSGVVFMGMGEPFANYDAVMEAVRIIHEPNGLAIGARHISISTCGILDGILRLIDEPLRIHLAVSLHAPNDRVRRSLMPIARTYTISELMETVETYTRATRRKVMFEYLVIGGVNDHTSHAHELADLLKDKLCMVNLISYNSTGRYRTPHAKRVVYFRDILRSRGVEATIRFRHGRSIKGACGQLATKSIRRTATDDLRQ